MPARHHRVTRGDDYRRIVRTGSRAGGALCIAYVVPRSSTGEVPPPSRFGYIISKAVGNAVIRNRVRRRMKAVSEALLAEGETARDIVFRAHPASATATFDDLQREMRRTLARAQGRS